MWRYVVDAIRSRYCEYMGHAWHIPTNGWPEIFDPMFCTRCGFTYRSK